MDSPTWWCGDFHTHMNGNGSENRWFNIETLCRKALRSSAFPFDTLFLGCHDFVCPKDLAKRAQDQFGLSIVRGAEITTTIGHVLALNIDAIPEYGSADRHRPLDIDLALRMIHDLGGKAVLAHAWRCDPTAIEQIAECLDGVEVLSLRDDHKHSIDRRDAPIGSDAQYPWLVAFANSDCHPWEGDDMHPDYATSLPRYPVNWFGREFV